MELRPVGPAILGLAVVFTAAGCGPGDAADRTRIVAIAPARPPGDGDLAPVSDGGADESADEAGDGNGNGNDGEAGPILDAGLDGGDGESPDRPPALGPDVALEMDAAAAIIPAPDAHGQPDAPAPAADAALELAAPATASGCGSGCKRVFVTAKGMASGALGSAAMGDAQCERLALRQQLGGTWRAWLSDGSGAPASRFSLDASVYRLLDGTVVAMGWNPLVTGALAHSIDRTESNEAIAAGTEVWTGTTVGGAMSQSTCDDWTSGSTTPPPTTGDVGLTSRSDYAWTRAYMQFCNHPDVHLYCFEQ